MSKRYLRQTHIVLVLLAVLQFGFITEQLDLFKRVENSFTLGNAKQLEDILNTSVELELPGEVEGIHSRSQTIAILNRFFDRFPPSAFKIVHSGHSASGSRFAVGEYITESERSFRVTIYAKMQGSAYRIQEIEFE